MRRRWHGLLALALPLAFDAFDAESFVGAKESWARSSRPSRLVVRASVWQMGGLTGPGARELTAEFRRCYRENPFPEKLSLFFPDAERIIGTFYEQLLGPRHSISQRYFSDPEHASFCLNTLAATFWSYPLRNSRAHRTLHSSRRLQWHPGPGNRAIRGTIQNSGTPYPATARVQCSAEEQSAGSPFWALPAFSRARAVRE